MPSPVGGWPKGRISMRKPTVSLCVIAKNEEEVIARCLQSAREAADEFIVVDTGSTDGTIEAARLAGAQVHLRSWKHDFAAARNESIALAKGEWILVMDADEALEEGHGPQLRKLLEDTPDADGFFIQIINYIGAGDKQVGSSASSALRLFRNKPGYRYEGRIHEQIVQPILNANPQAKLLYSSIRLNHGGYLPEVVQKKNKVQRNMELLLRELENSDNESFHRYNLGIEYMRSRQYSQALEQFRRSRSILDWRRASFGHVVILREVNCLQALGQWEEAAQVCAGAAEELKDYPDLFLTMGRIYYRLHQWTEAAAAFRKALEIGQAPPKYTSESGAGTYSASFYLGKTLEQLRDYEGAAGCYANALRFNSGLLPPFLRLIGLLSRTGQSQAITSILESLFRLESPQTWWSIALSYYQLGLYAQAGEILRAKPVLQKRKKDHALLLLRCKLLAEGQSKPAGRSGKSAGKRRTNEGAGKLSARKKLYEALAKNDDQAVLRQVKRLREQTRRNSSQSGQPNPADLLLLNAYTFLTEPGKAEPTPLDLPASAYSSLWSELYFLYTLAAKKHLFALQGQVQAYWHRLLDTLPDPVQRLRGRFELIKTVHVRIYHLFSEDTTSPEYSILWKEAKPQLMTLIDDLLMEEVT